MELWAGKQVLLRKQCNPEIKLVCATPFVGFEKNWDAKWRNLYDAVASKADYKYAICQTYTRYCFPKRNEWMVSHSGLVMRHTQVSQAEQEIQFCMLGARGFKFVTFFMFQLIF